MVVRATEINPAMLRWARERAGYSVEDIARRRRVSPERVREWEAGKSFPTWQQLKQLAYKDYHRGTVFFFLNDPPKEKTIAERFHRLPAAMLEDLHPDTLYAVRQAQIRQDDLAELLGPDGAGERFILRDLRGETRTGHPEKLAEMIREYLGVDLNDPEGFWNSAYTFEDFRNRVEDAGVWVFRRTFQQKDVSGLCLGDDVYPVIYLNNGQMKSKQVFTLFNGLTHLMFDFNYLERDSEEHYLESLTGECQAIETTCNYIAVDFLNDFEDATEMPVYAVYGDAKLTPPVVGERTRTGGDKGFYYTVQAANLGRKYLRAAFLAFEEQRIDETDLSSFLGVKGWHLDGLERYVWQ